MSTHTSPGEQCEAGCHPSETPVRRTSGLKGGGCAKREEEMGLMARTRGFGEPADIVGSGHACSPKLADGRTLRGATRVASARPSEPDIDALLVESSVTETQPWERNEEGSAMTVERVLGRPVFCLEGGHE